MLSCVQFRRCPGEKILLPNAVPHIFPWNNGTTATPSSVSRTSRLRQRASDRKKRQQEREREREQETAVNDVAMEVATTTDTTFATLPCIETTCTCTPQGADQWKTAAAGPTNILQQSLQVIHFVQLCEKYTQQVCQQ